MSRKPAKKKFLKRMGLLIGLSAAAACAGRRSTDRSWTRKPMRCSILQQRKRTVDHAAVRQKSDKNPTRSTCSKSKKSVCLSINYDGTAAGIDLGRPGDRRHSIAPVLLRRHSGQPEHNPGENNGRLLRRQQSRADTRYAQKSRTEIIVAANETGSLRRDSRFVYYRNC